MAKFYFEEDEAIWQRWGFTVEADSLEEARQKFDDGEWDRDSALLVDSCLCSTSLDSQIHEIRDEAGKLLWCEYEQLEEQAA